VSNVTLSVIVPAVEIVFEDDTAAVITSVDADTVLGVVPGTVGLQILAATTADAALTLVGAVGPIQAGAYARAEVAAHAASSAAHSDRPTFEQSILFASFFGG
jgi:hypothetical protein